MRQCLQGDQAMSLLRKIGPYVVCLVAGAASGAGLVYLLYIRLSRELSEIRKLLSELKHEVDLYSDGTEKRSKNRPRITGQYSVTASSGDDDDDFVDAVGRLVDDAITEPPGVPQLLKVRQNLQFDSTMTEEVKEKPDEERVLISDQMGDEDQTGNELNPDCDGSFILSREVEIQDADAKTEEGNEPDQ